MSQFPECPKGHEDVEYEGALFEDGAYHAMYYCNHAEVLSTATDHARDEVYEETGPVCGETMYDRIELTNAVDKNTGEEFQFPHGSPHENQDLFPAIRAFDGLEGPRDPANAPTPGRVKIVEYDVDHAEVQVVHPKTGHLIRLEFYG